MYSKIALLLLLIGSATTITPVAPAKSENKKIDSLTRAEKRAEIERIKKELEPLRDKARKTEAVKEAKKRAEEAMVEYYRTLRAEMIRLDPSKKHLVEREAQLQKELRSRRRELATR
ncbi:MAG: hypothetical protein NZM04_08590 [Methylacidiphilales bacterium]|nr:hypothetical protein [Candidatus Methylacidiphilales bacterium]MDW8349530.1 hypothetical protein [Verrucomicrobiae bacterium]